MFFKGCVCTFDLKYETFHVQYETFFNAHSLEAILINKNQHETVMKLFVELIKDIRICSQYVSTYRKKYDKCAPPYLIGQQSDPEFLIKFKNEKLPKEIKRLSFEILWKTPDGNQILLLMLL